MFEGIYRTTQTENPLKSEIYSFFSEERERPCDEGGTNITCASPPCRTRRDFRGALPSHQSLREERLIIKSVWIIRPAPVQEKVVCFKQLGIDLKLLPKRIYAGRANGRIRYFHIKRPVAVEQDRAIFAYIDPGMSTRSPLHSRGKPTVSFGTSSGRQAGLSRYLRSLRTSNISTAPGGGSSSGQPVTGGGGEQEAAFLQQALADADWDTVERHGGFDAAVQKINQSEQKRPPSIGAGVIDDFRLRGSSRGSRTGEN